MAFSASLLEKVSDDTLDLNHANITHLTPSELYQFWMIINDNRKKNLEFQANIILMVLSSISWVFYKIELFFPFLQNKKKYFKIIWIELKLLNLKDLEEKTVIFLLPWCIIKFSTQIRCFYLTLVWISLSLSLLISSCAVSLTRATNICPSQVFCCLLKMSSALMLLVWEC